MSYILAIANQKGGVGKTTTAVNIAASLAQKGKKILLVDLDPQSNASVAVSVENIELSDSVYPCLFDASRINQNIMKTPFNNLHVLPSHMGLAGAEIELSQMDHREYCLKSALNHIQNAYDIIVIDCPPALGMLTINALTAATGVLVPLQCEYYALEGISHLVRTIEMVKKNLNPSLYIMGISLTMYDRRAKLTTMVEEDVRSHFGSLVFQTAIPRNVRVSEAPSHGLPVVAYDKSALGSIAYQALSHEVLAKIKKDQKR